MITIKRGRLLQLFKIKNILAASRNRKFNYYSTYKGSILNQCLRGNVYILNKNRNTDLGLIIVNSRIKEIYYVPATNSLSIFRLIDILMKNFTLSSYTITLIYNKVNVEELKKYFSIRVTDNLIYMYKNDCFNHNNLIENPSLSIRNMIINKEEAVRVELQNNIFNNIKNRSLLTIDEVFVEEKNLKFLKNFCFILEVQNKPAGYGQIILVRKQFFLVNFGIVPEYRSKGYGYYFLNKIIEKCTAAGINELYLSVDYNNPSAIKLYKKSGFTEIYNTMTIKLES